MGLLDRIAARTVDRTIRRNEGPMDPADYWFNYGGYSYYGTPTTSQRNAETIEADFQGFVQHAYKQNAVIFACERVRLSVFSEARFQFRQIRGGRPGDFFGTQDLTLLEKPWTNGTTGDLLTRMLQEADFAGNAFYTVRGEQLRRMRPDWVSIVMGSQDDPSVTPADLDAELVAYCYWPGGTFSGRDPVILLPDEVAHFAPTPDPMAWYRGMSWLTPLIREIQADGAATDHKLAFFRNGATLQTVVSLDKDIKEDAFERFVRKMNVSHQGAANAYRTMFLGGGADVTVVGADLRQLDFAAVQGRDETRIAAAAGVHPTIVGLSEGLQGSSLNAGNFGQARRLFAEGTLSTLWRNVAASLATLVPPPRSAELWCDTRDVPFLREDQSDAAEIQQLQASTIVSLSSGGFTRESAVAATVAQDMTLLVPDPNWISVQVQQAPGGGPPASPVNGNGNGKVPVVVGAPKVRAAIAARAFNPAEPRIPGGPHGGEWGHGGGVVKDALKLAEGLTGQHALDAAPAKLTPGPKGHFGDYAGEKLTGPPGMGKVRALSEYEGVEYVTTNAYLRRGPRNVGTLNPSDPYDPAQLDKESNEENAARVAEIDKTMAASRLAADVQVHRIIKDGSTVFGRDAWFGHVIDWNTTDFDEQDRQVERWVAGERPDLTGLEWREDAYSSTTVDLKIVEAYAERFDRTRGETSGGTVILNIHVPKGTGGVQMSGIGDKQEAEILLERGLRMRVVKDHGEDTSGRRILDIEVIPGG